MAFQQTCLVHICLLLTLSTSSFGSDTDPSTTCRQSSSPQLFDIVSTIPTISLRNGVQLPVLSLGTAHVILEENNSTNDRFMGFQPERTYRQVQLALERGIRAFDCGRIYRSHRPMGQVLGEWFRTGQLEREHVFLTTKVFHGNAERVATQRSHMYNMEDLTPEQVTQQVRQEVEEALDDLGVGQIDLLLLHWPSSGQGGTLGVDQDEQEETDASSVRTLHRQRRLAAWRVLELFYQKGWARAIGVSNFSERHLQDLQTDGATIVPMVNQIEASLSVMYPQIFDYCREHEIVCQAFSPLKRGTLVENDLVTTLAQKYDKSLAQISLRFLYQYGYAMTFLSTNAERMVANHDIFDFALEAAEMEALSVLPSPDGNWGLPTPYDLD